MTGNAIATDATERIAPPWALLVAAGASGAAVMTVEMTAVRALQPFFGSTTQVWSNVIAVVLAALALGYAAGGRLADRRASAPLVFALMAAGGLLVCGTALLVTPVSRLFLAAGVDVEGMPSILARGSLGTALVVFAPPLVLAGTIAPLAIRLLASMGVGKAAGRVLGVSTAASVAGTYLPTLVLVPHLGSRGSMFAAAGALIVPAAAGLAIYGRRGGAIAAALVVAVAAAAVAVADARPARGAPPFRNGGVATVLAERESPYQYLTVRDDRFPGGERDRVLTINEGVYIYHSLKIDGRRLTDSRHYDDYSVVPMLLDLEPGADLRMAVVGFACGVNAGQWRHFWDGPFRLRVEGAELDPEVVDLAREFFDLPPPGDPTLDVTVADGRTWLASLPEETRYHVLVVDAFANEIYMPFHLGTREFFELCRRRLEPGGLLAINVYAVGPDAPNLAALENTLATAFGRCVRSSRYGGYGYLLVARSGGVPDFGRLAPDAVLRRFGDRDDVAEWDLLVDLAAEVAADTAVVEPRPGARVLTDDDAPLEFLTDRFVRSLEVSLLGAPPPVRGAAEGLDLAGARAAETGRRDELRELVAKQHGLLAAIAAAWGVVVAAGALLLRRL